MSYLSQFGGGGARRVNQVVGSDVPILAMNPVPGARSVTWNASGVANQLQTILSISGAGTLHFAGIAASSANTAYTYRLRVSVDDRVVRDFTATIAQEQGLIGIGFPVLGWNGAFMRVVGFSPQAVPFANSLKVEAAISLASSGALAGTGHLAYEVNAA